MQHIFANFTPPVMDTKLEEHHLLKGWTTAFFNVFSNRMINDVGTEIQHSNFLMIVPLKEQ